MNKEWIKAALIRALKTACQAAIGMIGTGAIGILDVDWISVLSASALAGVLSLLMSVAGLPEVDKTKESSLESKPELPEDYFERTREDEDE